MMTPVTGLILFLLIYFLRAVFADKHSLYYLYTIQSKTYDCTAVTLLNDRQIHFYNSTDEYRTAKQNWLKNISESDWITSTEKLQYDTQLLNKLLDTQINEFRHNQSGDHVLQWRHGCEGEQSSDGSLTVLNSINEFGYDGEDLIQFNCTSKTWITPEKNTEIEETWSKLYDAVKKCVQCEEILKMYLQYDTTDITQSQTPPAVHIFAKKSVRESRKLILTCLITGFYPKDVKMSLRKFNTEIPEHLITSSEVRPNDDGTYQLRKSVEIQEDEEALYNCYVNHSFLTKPVIKEWDGRCTDCPDSISHGLFIRVVFSGVVVLLWSVMLCLLIVKKRVRRRETDLRIVFEQISLSDGICTNFPHNIYLGLIIGVSVSGILAALGFLMLCVLVMIIQIARCPDCTDHISQGLMIGGVVSGMLVLLCPVILHVLIRKIIQCERIIYYLNHIYWDLIIEVVGLVLILYSATLCVLIWRIIKYGRRTDHLNHIYWSLMIGVVVVALILYSVTLCVLMIKKRDNKEPRPQQKGAERAVNAEDSEAAPSRGQHSGTYDSILSMSCL